MNAGLPLPGTVLAERYRIVSPLGHGGMGEVFRVYDLKLDQEVALKHLSPRLAGNPAALTRFQQEVRLARQVSHPNVCRVFDIGESGGRPFLTMELIDGEDLASLLLRIGRLLPAKGLEIAQQLCAGLAAIHDSGVLHRDLKPSNIMIDGRGRARITDFGISALSGEPAGPIRARAGTPAFMAPEQLAGGGATVRSDLYALGLVLYEILTGRPAGARPARPIPPSELRPDIDPQIDHVLLRCLDPDPEARPASARQLASLLPGLDPLAAALAAGETPSPALVASAASGGSLRPAVGLACLAGVVLACAGIIALSPQARLLSRVPLERSPEVLADRAEAMLPRLGVTRLPAEVRFGLDDDSAYFDRLRASGRSAEVPLRLTRQYPAVVFWYRRSPRPMVPQGTRVTREDPVPGTPGEVSVLLDPAGRLYRFERTPPGFLPAGPPRPPGWTPLFTAAGLDPKRFSPSAPEWTPSAYVDTRMAWEGSWTEPPHPPVPVRVEAGSLRGTPIYFRLIEPWELAGPPKAERRFEIERIIYNGFFVAVAFLALLLAVRNVRLARADTRWALRLGGFVFGAGLLITALPATSLAAGPAFWQRALGDSLRQAGMIGLCYLSLEPTLRRYRPERIISWTRLLSGRLRDPLVGRDVLLGTLLGSAMGLVIFINIVLAHRTGGTNKWHGLHLDRLQGASGFLGGLLGDLMISLLTTLSFLVFLTALRHVLRRESLALAVCWALATTVLVLRFSGPSLVVSIPVLGLGCVLFVLSWGRFGLLAGIVCYLTLLLALDYPMTGEVSVWYGWLGMFALVSILGLATYGCLAAVAGQPWWRGSLLED
jgi:serine/threonine-protein kinase